MGRLYGDSTPFPFDTDYLELVRGAVTCSVKLLLAQHAIDEARAAIAAADHARLAERARLDRVAEAVRKALLLYDGVEGREGRVAQRTRDAARVAVDDEISQIEGGANAEKTRRTSDIDRAREGARNGVEEFLRAHSLPGDDLSVSLRGEEQGYAGDATLSTTFGVGAAFRLAIPDAHDWSRLRRVMDVSPGCEVQVPHEAGWINKRLELQRIKLDKLWITDAALTPHNVRLTVRKGISSGPGYTLEVVRGGSGTIRELDENGTEKDVHPIEPDDIDSVRRLTDAATEALLSLATYRNAMITCSYDGTSFAEVEDPRTVATALIATLAPTVNEIERRSGGVDELILRRDVADGRREEKYVKKAELREVICALPIALRNAFAPLQLVPRSSLTPPPPAVAERSEEISMELIDDESAPRDLIKVVGR
jgi:hypothetical protein